MSNDNHSINEFDFQLICEYFSSTDRQGPGSEACTLKAFSYLKDLPNNPHIADLGCGTGSSSLAIAKHNKVQITAIDLFPQFIEKLSITEIVQKTGLKLAYTIRIHFIINIM